MKYKVGDKVRVRSDLEVGKIYGNAPLTSLMLPLLGKVATIKELEYGRYILKEDETGIDYWWTDEMFVPVPKELTEEKFKEQTEGHIEKLRKENKIEPEHYRNPKSKYSDLYDRWYHEHSIETFRAIIRAIAERYITRYENKNGVEDLEKGIYTLTRLKEYEEQAE